MSQCIIRNDKIDNASYDIIIHKIKINIKVFSKKWKDGCVTKPSVSSPNTYTSKGKGIQNTLLS